LKRFKINLFVSISVLAVSACASLPERPGRREAAFSKELCHEIFESLKTRNLAVKSFRGLAEVRYGSRLFGSRGETAILIKIPSDLRIDGLSEFGLHDSQLVSSKGDLVIYWAGDNHYYRGLATREQFARYLNVSLEPERAILLISGMIPLEEEEDYILETRKKGKLFVMRGRSSEVEIVQKDSSYLPTRYTAYDINGSRDYLVSYDDFRETGGYWFPNQLLARFWDPSLKIEIRYRGVEINPPIDQNLFKLKIPGDAIPIPD
jgi:outer membrane lipoprotein-sorting protein